MSRVNTSKRRSPAFSLGTLCIVLTVVTIGLAFALVQSMRSNGGHQANATDGSVAALTTQVAREGQLVVAAQTVEARQQQIIEQLQRAATAQPTPSSSDNGARSYLASFLIDKYSYVLYMDWTETNGFIKQGRILTADNYQAHSAKSFQFSGLDNSGSYGFTGTGSSSSMSFTGIRNDNGTLTVSGLPWSIFTGFLGGTFSQTLHPSSVSEFNSAVANLAHQGG